MRTRWATIASASWRSRLHHWCSRLPLLLCAQAPRGTSVSRGGAGDASRWASASIVESSGSAPSRIRALSTRSRQADSTRQYISAEDMARRRWRYQVTDCMTGGERVAAVLRELTRQDYYGLP